jgi:multicomponent Na+:H+ antiporter subunit G
MTLAVDIAGWVFLLLGSFFCVVGGVGILRLPDFYSRLHGAGITDTLGAGLIFIGLMIQAGISLVTVKLIMIVFFLYLTSPTATHAIAKAARISGLKPQLEDKDTEI